MNPIYASMISLNSLKVLFHLGKTLINLLVSLKILDPYTVMLY